MCDRLGIDVWEVVKAAATKPFGFMPFYPGPSLGGHCIPIDPRSICRGRAKQSGFDPRFIELANQWRDAALRRRQDCRSAESRSQVAQRFDAVWILGLAYKRDIDDIRESPSLDVMTVLRQRGARVRTDRMCRTCRCAPGMAAKRSRASR